MHSPTVSRVRTSFYSGIACHSTDGDEAYGFLASKEVKDAGIGNLAMQDRQCPLTSLLSGGIEMTELNWH